MSNSGEHSEAHFEAYKKEVVGLNVRMLESFLNTKESNSLPVGIDVRDLNHKEYDCKTTSIRTGDFGDIRKVGRVDVDDYLMQSLKSGSVTFGMPAIKSVDGQPQKPEGATLIINISVENSGENNESDGVLKESAFVFNVAHAESVHDLFTAIELFPGKIMASGKREIAKDDLKSKIIAVMEGKLGPEYITSNCGLRLKVLTLKSELDKKGAGS